MQVAALLMAPLSVSGHTCPYKSLCNGKCALGRSPWDERSMSISGPETDMLWVMTEGGSGHRDTRPAHTPGSMARRRRLARAGSWSRWWRAARRVAGGYGAFSLMINIFVCFPHPQNGTSRPGKWSGSIQRRREPHWPGGSVDCLPVFGGSLGGQFGWGPGFRDATGLEPLPGLTGWPSGGSCRPEGRCRASGR
jgi:hypothetical protein